jgi:uncharacterized tellurite resistance protein B-like protein
MYSQKACGIEISHRLFLNLVKMNRYQDLEEKMINEDKINYLANIISAIYADGKTYQSEEKWMNVIAKEIDASPYHIDKAIKLAESSEFEQTLPERYSDSIRLLEDVLLILNADRHFDAAEKEFTRNLASRLHLTQHGINKIQEYCRKKVKKIEE